MDEFKEYNIILIGLGPHAKRIYMNLFKKYKITPRVIVDLKSKKDEIVKFLEEKQFANVELVLLNDERRDDEELSNDDKTKLRDILKEKKIKYAIISTEPKAHFAYAKFMIENDINVLVDKPITAPIDVCNNPKQAMRIKTDYEKLCEMYLKKKDKITCKVQCQRRYHDGYIYIKRILDQIVREFNIPITYLDIYHNDGMWNMPSEFIERENHPYKYGYGKLFHSGYHFIDLMAWLLEINRQAKGKQIDNAEMYVSTLKPSDFFNVFNNYDYKNILRTNRFEKVLTSNTEEFKKYGEIDFHSVINFKQDDNVITNCSLNLMQSGFSRRAWSELPQDTYKANGRIRHERINVQVGPLLDIQVHSYQAYEIADREKINSYDVGGVEHFDIYIFRNSELIGGKPFEKINMATISGKDGDEYIKGYNERAREKGFVNFLLNLNDDSDLLKHKASIEITEKAYEMMSTNKDVLKFNIKI